MIGVGRIRGNALAPVITLSAADLGGGTVRLTWTSTNVITSKLYDPTPTLLNTGGASGFFDVAQGYGLTKTYSITGTNAFGGTATAFAVATSGSPVAPAFTSVTQVASGWHPDIGQSWQVNWVATNATSVVAYRNGPSYVSTSNTHKRVTYKYTGGTQNFVVPTGVTSIIVNTWGAQGGTAKHHPGISAAVAAPGGKGAKSSSVISVTPGETIQVVVGGAGTGDFYTSDVGGNGYSIDNPYFQNDHTPSSNFLNTYYNYLGNNFYLMNGDYNANPYLSSDPNIYKMHPGGYNGGGKAYGYMTASGGGASDIRKGGTALANRLCIAGGGGGGSISQVDGMTQVNYNYDLYPWYPSSIPNTGGDGGGGNGANNTPARVNTAGRGASGGSGGLGGPRTPKSISPSSDSNGTLGAGGFSHQFKDSTNAGTTSSGSGVNYADGTTVITTKGAYADYGSGGGGGYYGGGAGNFAQDNWYHSPNGTEYLADPGGGALGFSIGAGGGGSCLADSFVAGVRVGNGLVVISYIDPAAGLPGTGTGQYNIDIPFGSTESFLLRATGPGGTTDYTFTTTAPSLASLDT